MSRGHDDRRVLGEGTPEARWLQWPGLERMASVSADQLLAPGQRAVVVAPHPDDEVLSVGGLLAQLARRGLPVRIVAVTDGSASHRGSSLWSPARLTRERPRESRQALARLGLALEPLRLGLPDGGLAGMERRLAERLRALLRDSDVVFSTWRFDGHPDHEATGRACADAAERVGAAFVEVPVWAWHWAEPGDARLPWARAARLALDTDAQRRKQYALQAFESQLAPDPSTGKGPILRASTVERAGRPFEVFFR